MNPTDHIAKAASKSKTRHFALLRGFISVKGTRAPKIGLCVALTLVTIGFTTGSANAALVHAFLGSEEPSAYTPFPGHGISSPRGETAMVDESVAPKDWAKGDTYEMVEKGPPNGLSAAIDVFTPSRELVGELKLGQIAEFTVSRQTGDLIVNVNEEVLDMFEPAGLGKWSSPVTLTRPNTANNLIGVDQSTGEAASGEIFVYGEIFTPPFFSRVVEEFSPSGEYLGEIAGACKSAGEIPPCGGGDFVPFGAGFRSVSVDPATHDVYVEESTANVVDIFGPDIFVPDVTTGAISGLTQTSVVLSGTVNPIEQGPASCTFAWGTSDAFGHSLACSEEVKEGDSPVTVDSVKLEGLVPDTEYCYRLQAENKAKGKNAGGLNAGEETQNRCFTTPGPADVLSDASSVTADSAIVQATVDPRGASTSFYVQYSTASTAGCGVTPAVCTLTPLTAVGQGEAPVSGEQLLQDLAPSTLYHYRVIELREGEPRRNEEIAGEDHTFTTQGTLSGFVLPDGRQYELVSPPVKLGALFHGAHESEADIGENAAISEDTAQVTEAAASGDAFVAEASQPTEAQPQGNANGEIVLMSRSADGAWSSQVLSAPHREATGVSLGLGQEVRIFSEDLSRAVVDPFGSFTPLSPEAVEQTAYLRTNFVGGGVEDRCEAADTSPQSCYRPLVSRADTAPGVQFGDEFNGQCTRVDCGPMFLAANASLSAVILGAREPLTEAPVAVYQEGFPDLLGDGADYEWHEGSLTLVNILPGASAGGGALVVSYSGDTEHVVSESGRYVILEGVKPGATNSDGGLYLRDVLKGETVELNPPGASCHACGEAQRAGGGYQTANAEDTRVFFLSEGLTSDSSGGEDLYECALTEEAGKDACRLSDLTPLTDGEPSDVVSVLGASEDGSWVYFLAGARLAQGAVAGALNLYVRHEGVTSFIARISGEDLPYEDVNSRSQFVFANMRARVSPNGRWLAFMSNRSLTGYDNIGDEEVYLYHAPEDLQGGRGTLACASCDPTGARPAGVGGIAASTPEYFSNGYKYERESVHQPRFLEDSGRLFFDAKDALVPSDTNGVIDVYEYEPEGVPAGSSHACSPATQSASEVFKPAHTYEVQGVQVQEGAGCVALISSGTSTEESVFLDASETGSDVFFLTSSKLTDSDAEGGLSIFDAQECTSSAPCLPEAPLPPPPCNTEASCRPSPTPQPAIYGAPPSATFSGPGNLIPEVAPPPKKVIKKTVKCKRGFVKNKKNKCVRKKTNKKAKKTNHGKGNH